jgi:hypothetical protein
MTTFTRLLGATLAFLPAGAAFACASCGCSLSSDWESQGLASGSGLRFDLRYDSLQQNQVRSGTGQVHTWPLPPHEQELYTKNQYLTAALDYSVNADWGLNVQIPLVTRSHASNGLNYDGTDDGHSQASHRLGDVKVVGRYQGWSDARNFGVQFGVKLPTGSYTQSFDGGAMAGEPLDRGLQVGTGTTDLILGAFLAAPMSQNWDYFVQALAQLPLNSRADYRPGRSLNANLGVRYLGWEHWVPQLQINARVADRDSGTNATPDDSGGKTVYLSPGLSVPITDKLRVYGFVQLPLHQNLNGYQLAPKRTLSVGTRMEF